MKILITGYKGFIGQNMVNALKDEHELTLYEWGEELPEFAGLDWCIHLGAISSTTENDIHKILTQNYDFSRYVINSCNDNNVHLQFASSASIYGRYLKFTEDSSPDPLSPYAWSKYLFERYVLGFKNKWTIRVQGFRYFNVYGPFEDHKGEQASPYHKFEKQAKETGVIKLFKGSKGMFRDFVPVERVIEIHKQFFNIEESGIWNLGTGKPTTFESIAQSIAEKYNAEIGYIPMPENIASQYQKFTLANLDKLNGTLNAHNGKRNI
jgi:ADP-L-glycero-D-manno-heptose 6-epimerase